MRKMENKGNEKNHECWRISHLPAASEGWHYSQTDTDAAAYFCTCQATALLLDNDWFEATCLPRNHIPPEGFGYSSPAVLSVCGSSLGDVSARQRGCRHNSCPLGLSPGGEHPAPALNPTVDAVSSSCHALSVTQPAQKETTLLTRALFHSA